MHNYNATISRRLDRVWILATTALLSAAFALWTTRAPAQDVDQQPLTAAELETLVGPIALYPDEVLAVVLPAATYPLQIVQAARFLDEREANSGIEPSGDWDDSVVALLNYPEVVRLMNDDLDWTWTLGEAVLDDQPAVLDAIQAFRDRAYDAGNLVSDDRQQVVEEDGVITIAPADPEVVYIPYYEPETIVVYQPRPVYRYYPYAYPLYYYPYPYGYRFSTGFFWGVTSAFTIGWHSHYIHLHHHTHYRHPYYRRTYYTPYYARRSVNVTVNVNNYRNVWRPHRTRGARPYDGIHRVRSGDRVARTFDGRRYRYADGSTRVTRTTEGQRAGSISDSAATLPRLGSGARVRTDNRARVGTGAERAAIGSVAGNRARAPDRNAEVRTRPGRVVDNRARPGGTTETSPAIGSTARTGIGSGARPGAARSANDNNARVTRTAPTRRAAPARTAPPTRGASPARGTVARGDAGATARRVVPAPEGRGNTAALAGGTQRSGAARQPGRVTNATRAAPTRAAPPRAIAPAAPAPSRAATRDSGGRAVTNGAAPRSSGGGSGRRAATGLGSSNRARAPRSGGGRARLQR